MASQGTLFALQAQLASLRNRLDGAEESYGIWNTSTPGRRPPPFDGSYGPSTQSWAAAYAADSAIVVAGIATLTAAASDAGVDLTSEIAGVQTRHNKLVAAS